MLTLRVADLRLGACCQGHSLEQPREGFSRCWLFLIKLIRENCCHRYNERTLPTTVRSWRTRVVPVADRPALRVES